MSATTIKLSSLPTAFKSPKAFDRDFYHAARPQGGEWRALGEWTEMLPAQRRVYRAIDRLRVLQKVPTTFCERCRCRKHCALTKEIRKAERAVAIAKTDPDCIAYDEMIQRKRPRAVIH